MAREPEFEGFHYDAGRAEAMADAIAATFRQAALFNVTVPDLLAALGIAAARVILSSKLAPAPQLAAGRLAAFIVSWATLVSPPGSPPR